jgi:hypothetical protein
MCCPWCNLCLRRRRLGSRTCRGCCKCAAPHSAAGSWRTRRRCCLRIQLRAFSRGPWSTLALIRSGSPLPGQPLSMMLSTQSWRTWMEGQGPHGGCLGVRKDSLANAHNLQVEFYTLEYAEALAASQQTWPLAAEYLAWCPMHGEGALARLLEDLPLATSSDRIALKALQASKSWSCMPFFGGQPVDSRHLFTHACHPLHAQQEHPWG